MANEAWRTHIKNGLPLAVRFLWRRHPDSNWGWSFCRALPYHLAMSPYYILCALNWNVSIFSGLPAAAARAEKKYGAGDEARTRYLHLGKVALYQMSYTRVFAARVTDPTGGNSVGWAGPPNGVLLVPPVGIEPTTRGFSVPCSTN